MPTKPQPSTRHSNVAPASEVNENVGVLSPVVPLGPSVIVVSGAVVSDVSTVKDRLAGVGSVEPTPSVARTSKTCAPSDSAPVVNGELQDANAAASTRHSILDQGLVPSGEGEHQRYSSFMPLSPAMMVVSGGVVSTVNDRLAGEASVLPTPSFARLEHIIDSVAVVNGEEQDANTTASTRHSKVAPASEVKENVGVLSLVGPDGPAVMVVSRPGHVHRERPTRRRGVGVARRRRRAPRTSVLPVDSAPVVNGDEQDAERRRVDPALERRAGLRRGEGERRRAVVGGPTVQP